MTHPIAERRASLYPGGLLSLAGWISLGLGAGVPLFCLSSAAQELTVAFGVTVLPLFLVLSIVLVFAERLSPRHWPCCEISDDGRRVRVVELRGSRRYRKGFVWKKGLRGGLVLPQRGNWPPMVELVTKGGSLLRIVDAAGSAQDQWQNAWLERYRLDAAHAPARGLLGVPVPWVFWAGLLSTLLGPFSLEWLGEPIASPAARLGILFVWSVAVAVVSLLVARPLAPRIVEVGSDGVRIEHAFRSVYVPHADIERVEFSGRAGLRITAQGSRALRVGFLFGVARRDGLEALIEEWFRRGTPLPESLAVLRRAGRPVAAWLDELGQVLGTTGYRANAPTLDDLLLAIDNPLAPVELRIGAIVALSKAGPLAPAVVERLRSAAASSASWRLAKALGMLADGVVDAQVIQAALAEGAAVQSGVRTAHRSANAALSPAAQRDAIPEGGQTVATHFDSFMLAIVGLPIFPLGISVASAVGGDNSGLVLAVPLALVWVPYIIAWIVSRARSERRFVFYPDRVWLPGFYHRLRGRFVALQDISHLAGDSEHFKIVLRNGRTRMYEGNVVDFSELEKMFERFGVKNRR